MPLAMAPATTIAPKPGTASSVEPASRPIAAPAAPPKAPKPGPVTAEAWATGANDLFSKAGLEGQVIGQIQTRKMLVQSFNRIDKYFRFFNPSLKALGWPKGEKSVVLDLQDSLVGRRLCETGVGVLEEVGVANWQSAGAVDETRGGKPACTLAQRHVGTVVPVGPGATR